MATAEPETDFVTLVSSDGYEFVVQRSCANISDVIKRALDPTSGFKEAQENKCVLEEIDGLALEKVCEYLYYHEKYRDARDVPEMEIPPELCLELVVVADYLKL